MDNHTSGSAVGRTELPLSQRHPLSSCSSTVLLVTTHSHIFPGILPGPCSCASELLSTSSGAWALVEVKSNCHHAACFASLELHHPGEANDALAPKRSKRSCGPHCALGSSAQHTLPKAQKLHSLHSYPCALLMACGHLFSYTEQLSLQLCLKDTQKSPQKF